MDLSNEKLNKDLLNKDLSNQDLFNDYETYLSLIYIDIAKVAVNVAALAFL